MRLLTNSRLNMLRKNNHPQLNIMKEKLFKSYLPAIVFCCLFLASCGAKKEEANTASEDSVATESLVVREPFGEMPDGKNVTLYTLKNKNGLTMGVINYGGIIVSLKAPDKNGTFEDVVLGFDSLSDYIKNNPYFGAIVGRFGNRIANAKFTLDGQEHTLAANDGANHLHGGIKGFDKVYWEIAVIDSLDQPSIKLSYVSPDGEEGYPGTLDVEVVYTLTNEDALQIDYTATTDKKTVLNLTQHSYFNLSGNMEEDILDDILMINADTFLPVNRTLIPTGELQPVENTPFDFTEPTAIGARINDEHTQIAYGGGYDHCWVLNEEVDLENPAATVYDSTSGRFMEVFTTEPGIQFYAGNFLDGSNAGKGGTAYGKRSGLCLETQHFPDSPNQPEFPSVELNPGETYETTTIYKFSVK